MSGTLDLTGDSCVIRIRRGSDQTIDFECKNPNGTPFDLNGQQPAARVMDGSVTHDLEPVIVGSSIVVNILHDLTVMLSNYTEIAVSITDNTGAVTPLVYGQLVTIQEPTA